MAGPRRFLRRGPKKTAKSKRTAKKPFPLMALCDDVLYNIIDQLEKGDHYCTVSFRLGLPSRLWCLDDLRNLSLVNKRLREVLTPRLFKYARIADFVGSVRPGESMNRLPLIESLNMMAEKPLILNSIQ